MSRGVVFYWAMVALVLAIGFMITGHIILTMFFFGITAYWAIERAGITQSDD